MMNWKPPLSRVFGLPIAIPGEPTNGLEPLICSSYEFACTRSRLSYCVRKWCLFMGFSVLLARLLVHCVLACTSPVAVPVAVSSAVACRQREGTDEGAVGRELYLSWVTIGSGTSRGTNPWTMVAFVLLAGVHTLWPLSYPCNTAVYDHRPIIVVYPNSVGKWTKEMAGYFSQEGRGP